MAIYSGFFNSIDGDRLYNAEDIGRYLHGIITPGVYADSSSSLQVLSTGDMSVEVQAGRAMINYHFMENTTPFALTLVGGSSLPRYDAIIAKLDADGRQITIEVKQGTPAADPVPPEMRRNETAHEYMLAKIYVPALATAITQEEITDTRADTTVCGWVTGAIQQVDTSTLFIQWQTAYENAHGELEQYMDRQQAAFDEWFAGLTEELNVATFLQEYTITQVMPEDTATVQIGISDYNVQEDVLFVNVAGLIWPKSGYTISGDGSTAALTFINLPKAGEIIEFRVLKSKIGSASMDATLAAADDTGAVITDGGAVLSV